MSFKVNEKLVSSCMEAISFSMHSLVFVLINDKHVKCIQTLAGWHGQVKVGTVGAEQFGDFEEWFNYRLSRAAPETCAEFLGSFVADRTNSQFIKGGKWLVWKFEVLYLILSLHKQQA